MPTTAAPAPATDKQTAFILRLAAERDLEALSSQVRDTVARVADGGTIPARWASRLIEVLLGAPRSSNPDTPAATPGYYVRDGHVIAVVENRDHTRTYAKVLRFYRGEDGARRASWEYAPNVARTLAGTAPLSPEEAAKLGHLHGVCVVCARTLTDPKSVEAGIGPVCAARLAG